MNKFITLALILAIASGALFDFVAFHLERSNQHSLARVMTEPYTNHMLYKFLNEQTSIHELPFLLPLEVPLMSNTSESDFEILNLSSQMVLLPWTDRLNRSEETRRTIR